MDGPLVLVPLVGTISVFGCIGFIAYLYLKGRNKERMALIETGQDASIFKRSEGIHQNLKWGFLAIAIGIALFVGHFLDEYTTMDELAYLPMIFLLGGGALLLYYKRAKDDGLDL